ncbi:putative disease resistance protein RGA4 [Impatiens glandulifera]|uniref:putative disease resistance protein RGA4 n=1 Tax=Impatiens glandulifera TaxID=253017 RepID=UPI001FB065D7|nr:putative disease resistance protein RGA4 [Impatiens glandulifera]
MVDAALISGLVSNLAPLINDEFSLFWSFKKEVQKLSSTLSAINAVLNDAERKTVREKDEQTEDWLRKLKDVLYEVRDIMDECSFEDLRLQVKRRNASSSTRIKVTNFITHPFNNTKTRLKIGHKIKDVQEKLDQISSERQKLHLRESIHDTKIDKFASNWRETMSLPSSSKVYGRDKEKKQIIDILLNNTSSVSVATELSVLPIVGIGGLGKTTLSQMVFNDDQVSKHFHPKIWVCVSDEFDIKLIIKAIVGANNETSLEILQKMIQDKLRGKRYLIVLDDVWNENADAWNQLRSILDCGSNGAFVLTTTRKGNVAKIMKNQSIPHFELSSLSEDDCWLLFEERAFEHGKPKPPNFINIGKEIAKKCKGVPLAAKTLGSQLGFKGDEKEWCRVRDSEIWEISQNEESNLFPILRLSYYDLPYYLRRCFVFCAIFPKDTKIEKETLIQLWMAHGLIPKVKNQEMEDVGNTIWKELCWRSFFQDENDNKDWYDTVYTTCKIHDLMHDLAQSIMRDESYTIDANSSSDELGQEIHHVTIMVHKLDKTSICSLKKIRGLQSIMFKSSYCNVTKDIWSVLKELSSLRVLEVRRHVQYEDLSHVGCLKHLRYLDISYSQMTSLPNSICDLLNLQTLKLNNCFKLESLPRNTMDLINLRHLYLEGCNGLKYMPRGMGQLKYLNRLSLFVIGNEERDCQLDEIKELDIGGSLTIKNLGRVRDASIARGISMATKSSINSLKLEWTSDDEAGDNQSKSTRHEKIGEALEISTTRLKILRMYGYKGVNIPKWVRKPSLSLTRLVLKGLDNVNNIATSHDMNGIEVVLSFPFLKVLTISNMKNLRELVSPTIHSPGTFPNLCTLQISYCPKLGALPPHLKALKHVIVWGDCSDELLYSISNLSALTHLSIQHMEERCVLFRSGKALMFDDEIRSTFQSLQSLSIWGCKKLRRLLDEGMIMQETLKISAFQNQQKHHLLQGQQTERTRAVINLMNSLNDLDIHFCPELMISVEEFGNLNINNSLQRLFIKDCPKLVSSKEADDVMELLRSLRARLDPMMFHVDILLHKGRQRTEQSIVSS